MYVNRHASSLGTASQLKGWGSTRRAAARTVQVNGAVVDAEWNVLLQLVEFSVTTMVREYSGVPMANERANRTWPAGRHIGGRQSRCQHTHPRPRQDPLAPHHLQAEGQRQAQPGFESRA